MRKYLNLGNAGFTSVRKGIYVDKTGLISFINGTLGTKEKLTCVSRPRRFGKSFAAQMLCAYYDKTCDSRSLFAGLEIASDRDYLKYLNKYDVIYLDITWFISICRDVGSILDYLQEQVVEELAHVYPSVALSSSLPEALSEISGATGNKFIIIIDEWDALFREAKEDAGLQKEYIQLLRGLFKSSLTDTMIEAAYMTGILPIKKYGTQSAMTDFREYTMLAPKRTAPYVGFTELEVKKLCREYKMDFGEAKKWYDGYSFRTIKSVYNPNSIMEAMKSSEFGSYWTQTETYEALRFYIDLDNDGLQEAIASMIGGAHLPVDTGTFQNDMTSIGGRDDVLTLLIHLGYLTYDAEEKKVSIPNEEVRQEFVRAVKFCRHTEIANLVKNSDKLLRDTLDMDASRVAAPVFYNDEQALRSVVRFAYISCVEEFLDIQEPPSGRGYADIVYLPKKSTSMPILVVELKWNKTAEGALAQIKERNYPQIFEGYGSEMLLVGINYDVKTKKHTCAIERHQRY